MTVRRVLSALIRVVIEETERNSDFDGKVRLALDMSDKPGGLESRPSPKKEPKISAIQRPRNRRPPAVIDPVQLARQGETTLRTELGRLNLDQLRDIVADYGMDTGKLVMKWRAPDRIIDRIVEVSMSRAQKGNAFRE
jgi:hypothetical protein